MVLGEQDVGRKVLPSERSTSVPLFGTCGPLAERTGPVNVVGSSEACSDLRAGGEKRPGSMKRWERRISGTR
jgi:hypothetical protein